MGTPKTDRELDAIIARTIMGLTVIDIPFIPGEVEVTDKTYFTDIARDSWQKVYPNSRYVNAVPHYTSARDQAADVLKKIGDLDLGDWFGSTLLSEAADASGLTIYEVVITPPRQLMETALRCFTDAEKRKG